jgi:hypothetical protein
MCRRRVVVAWHRDGTDERVCSGCVNRTLREADRINRQQDYARLWERLRRQGLG